MLITHEADNVEKNYKTHDYQSFSLFQTLTWEMRPQENLFIVKNKHVSISVQPTENYGDSVSVGYSSNTNTQSHKSIMYLRFKLRLLRNRNILGDVRCLVIASTNSDRRLLLQVILKKKSYFKIKGKKEERKQWKASQLMRDIFGNMIVLQLIRRG